ncbi:nuclease PIN [Arthrobacter sp. zg-ZUI100]|uniref:Nuclease PIN n=1 Tax=Arthrobacter jiangjiafuii TaxID=2817475 RepID=A0A975M568_9MICC|nr:nuclease PIN [Arthrobacter jiangjiafuii]MBP3035789.1 nuclease PIN [Arthrobacter jiangjiafuii]MBP3042018.1 nuclease PIN [Arthrobacter jiangjiafuii]QWC10193.1 nuclease PIN [Arthrobacter jiangjiafuii]
MRLRLFPQENAGLELLSRMGSQLVRGVGTLSEVLGAEPDDYNRLAEQMHQLEAETTDLHFALMTQMRTSFINPLPREDLYHLSLILMSAMEALDAAAEVLALYRLGGISGRAAEQLEVIGRQAELTVGAMRRLASLEELEDYWIEMLRLAKRSERTYRIWVSELLRDHKPLTYARHRDLADQLLEATTQLRRCATAVGGILVRES